VDWYEVKLLIVGSTHLSRDAAHILAGVGGQFLFALLLRRGIGSPLPWLIVLVLEVANEWFDLTYEQWRDRPMWPGSVQDVWVTMLVPTALMLIARYAPTLLIRERTPTPASDQESPDPACESTGLRNP
jgi:hypothetical protein